MDEYLTPRYVWITLGWYPPRWWTRAVSEDDPKNLEVPCSDSELEAMLNRSLVIAQYPNASEASAETDVALVSPLMIAHCYMYVVKLCVCPTKFETVSLAIKCQVMLQGIVKNSVCDACVREECSWHKWNTVLSHSLFLSS